MGNLELGEESRLLAKTALKIVKRSREEAVSINSRPEEFH